MFKPTPTKLTKEQLDALISQTSMFKEYFSNLESCAKTGQSSMKLFPFSSLMGLDEHIEFTIEQSAIYKNYFSTTETYLKMMRANLDMWHDIYINPKK